MMFEERDHLDGLHRLHIMGFYEMALWHLRRRLESPGPVVNIFVSPTLSFGSDGKLPTG